MDIDEDLCAYQTGDRKFDEPEVLARRYELFQRRRQLFDQACAERRPFSRDEWIEYYKCQSVARRLDVILVAYGGDAGKRHQKVLLRPDAPRV